MVLALTTPSTSYILTASLMLWLEGDESWTGMLTLMLMQGSEADDGMNRI